VTVGAGVTLSRLQEHVRAAGLEVGVDFGARDSATIGGILATNAGGERVVRYGMVRAQIVGLEAVLPDGRVVSRLGGLVKDNSGYDLTGLVVGSEGTLAVITAARLRLFPRAPATATALLSLDDVAAAVSAVGALRARAPGLLAAELFLQSGLDLVCTQLGMAPPSLEPAPVYLLVECGGDASIDETLATAIAGLDGVRDAVVAPNEDMRRRLWEYRESHPLAINAVGPPLKLDVAVPLRSFAAYVEGVAERLATIAPDARLVLFGHLAEGNLHVNIVGLADEQFDAVADDLLHQVRDYAGSISAEHGVGVLKARWLHLGRTAEEIDTMVAIKRALDPHGVLSPHTLFAGER
jgi:FAD/FMN-containing dehydrogenase